MKAVCVIDMRTESCEEFTVEAVAPKHRPVYSFFKRVFDILLSAVSGVVLAVPMLVIALLIKLDSPGPVLFKQDRLGKNGKPFVIYKFRSMRLDAEADGPRWADPDDERCTRLGRYLRKCRLDELPQLWNFSPAI